MTAKRILVIEDDLELCEVIRLSLETMADLEVITAHTGQSGLAMVAASSVDAVLLDVSLPDWDGLEVCRRLRQQTLLRSLPVVLLTANPYRLDPAQLQALKITAVLPKPFRPAHLAQQLLQALAT